MTNPYTVYNFLEDGKQGVFTSTELDDRADQFGLFYFPWWSNSKKLEYWTHVTNI